MSLPEIIWGEVTHSLIAITAFTLVSGISLFFGPFAYRFSIFRKISRKYKLLEQFSGIYVQVIYESSADSGGVGDLPFIKEENAAHLRYSIVEIFYHHREQRYALRGSQYESTGKRTTVFTSELVGIREDIVISIEFVWRTEELSNSVINPDFAKESPTISSAAKDPRSFNGYTRMTFNDPDDYEGLDGNGFFKSFASDTKVFDFYFFRISSTWLATLAMPKDHRPLEAPQNERDRRQFIASLHQALVYAENRHLQIIPERATPFI